MNKLFLFALACSLTTALHAQDSTYRPASSKNKKADKKERINRMLRMEEEGDLIFNKQNVFGFKVATDGYGIFFEKGKFITPTKTRLIQFELNEKKSPKEKTVGTGDFLFGTSEVLYKLNNFYQFKVSVGQQQLIGGKGNKNGVSVTALYTAGLSLGILKPYYINIQNDSGVLSKKTFTEVFKDSTYFGDLPGEGSSGFTVGWNHVSFKPGLTAKAALRFDYGRFNTLVSAIEAGVNAEFYFSKIPQVYNVPYKQFFFNAYVSIMFGSRK